MPRLIHRAIVLAALRVTVGSVLCPPEVPAQQAPAPSNSQLARMRTDLANGRYAEVVAAANAWLESARPITRPERIQLWQFLAAAYYPRSLAAQKPDSARLPLEALLRLEPDFAMARDISWSGLDSLANLVRAATFAAAIRPESAYTLRAGEKGVIRVVATRPTRFRIVTVAEASGHQVLHDSSAYITRGELLLRTHEAGLPIFTEGNHRLVIWAFDGASGDSVTFSQRIRATRQDLRNTLLDSAPAAQASSPVPAVAAPVSNASVSTQRNSILLGGIAISIATAVIAQDLRPNGAIRSAYAADSRSLIVGAAMLSAAVINHLRERGANRPARAAKSQSVTPPAAPAPLYRVRLLLEPVER